MGVANVVSTLAEGLSLLYTTEFTVEKSRMCAVNVGSPFVKGLTSLHTTREFTLEKSCKCEGNVSFFSLGIRTLKETMEPIYIM